jgi:hypothetical protein
MNMNFPDPLLDAQRREQDAVSQLTDAQNEDAKRIGPKSVLLMLLTLLGVGWFKFDAGNQVPADRGRHSVVHCGFGSRCCLGFNGPADLVIGPSRAFAAAMKKAVASLLRCLPVTSRRNAPTR